ncbi:MAG: dihydrofolate reductase family protein [Actinomycetota bacterium]|nr:dihydrofolate reductase family protein [Actinomycetota bacterium]
MRKLIVCNIISLDGYFEGPGNDVMALPFDPAFDDYNAERLRAADTLLQGRTTFEQSKSYWPSIAADPTVRPVEREISGLFNDIEKIVVSDSLTPKETPPWQDTRIFRRAEAHHQIAELKHKPGKDILVIGSHKLWNDLLSGGLIDELHLMIGAGVLGAGTPAFEGGSPVALELLESRTLDGSQLVLTRYGVRANGA